MNFATAIAALELVATRAQTCAPVVSCSGVFDAGQRAVAMNFQSQKSRKIVIFLKISAKGFYDANFATPIAPLELVATRAQPGVPVVSCSGAFDAGQRAVAMNFQSRKSQKIAEILKFAEKGF